MLPEDQKIDVDECCKQVQRIRQDLLLAGYHPEAIAAALICTAYRHMRDAGLGKREGIGRAVIYGEAGDWDKP